MIDLASKEELKAKMKASVGKIKKFAKEEKHDAASKIRSAKANVMDKYDSGVIKTQNSAFADKMADLVGGLTAKNEKELLQDEDGTFRKIRKVMITAGLVVTPFIIGLPIKMVDEAIQRKVDLKNAEKYDKTFEREILWTEKEIKEREKKGEKTDDLKKYLESLKKARAKNTAYIEKVKKDERENDAKTKATKEAIEWPTKSLTMNPMLKFHFMKEAYYPSKEDYEEDLTTTFFEAMQYAANRVKYPTWDELNAKPEEPTVSAESVQFPQELSDKRKSAIIMATSFITNSMMSDKTLSSSLESACTAAGKSVFHNGSVDKITLFSFDYDRKVNTRSMNTKLETLMDSLNKRIAFTGCKVVMEGSYEAPKVVMEGIVQKAEDTVRAVVHKARDVAPNENPLKTAERVTSPVDNAFNKLLDDVKNALRSDTKDAIVHGQYRVKLLRIIAKCIAVGGLYYIHPALAAIGILGKLAYDKSVDQAERTKITNDLKTEIEITTEKIEDAKSKGDNESKYKLMRIKKALESEQARIQLHLDK